MGSNSHGHRRQDRRAGASLAVVVLFCCRGAGAFLLPNNGPVGYQQHYVAPSMTRLHAASSNPPKIEVTTELVRKTAQLAQLSFEEEELARLVPRIESFLKFADKMQEVKDSGEGAVPSTQPVVTEVLREDKSSFFAAREAIFSNMPAQEDGCLMIAKVGEEEL